jgi:hypothetical protein
MNRYVGALSLLALSAIGCARMVRVESESPGTLEPVMMPANSRALPTGTDLYVELDNRIGRETRVGDLFSATVRHAVYAQNGARVVPAGAKVYGRVAALDEPSYAGEPTAIRLDFNRLVFAGRSYPFDAQIASTDLDTRVPARSLSERVILTTTAIGALVGAAISGGEISGIVGGAVVGAVGGVVYSYARRGGGDAALPSGTRMTLRTTRPVLLRSTTRATTATTRRRSYRP